MQPIPSRLILGWSLDGAPAQATGPWVATVGPAALRDLLATWLGLDMMPAPVPVRIAACVVALRQAQGFWHRSFSADPWSTARAVLALHDGLRLAGWDGTADAEAPRRIADLARLSMPLPPGEPELLGAIAAALEQRPAPAALPALQLLEPAALWPFAWRRIFAALGRHGVAIAELPCDPLPAAGDLASLRRAMEQGGAAAWRGDGSLCLLSAGTEIEAADALSAWLAGAPAADLALVKPGGGLLDLFLRARHQPRLGGDAGPPGGLLPLALALRWEPFDAGAALEFLGLHRTPLGRASRVFSGAIGASPGHGGPAWRQAVRRALCDRLRRLRAAGVARADRKRSARQLLDDIGFWLPASRHERGEGIPAAEVAALCSRLIAWAVARGDEPSAGPASLLARTVAALGEERLSPALLGRMLDAVASMPSALAEAALWSHAAGPGALVEGSGTMVWWLADAPAGAPAPWRAAELAWMARQGLQPDDPAARRGRERAALLRGVAAARGRLVLVRPRAIAGQATPAHPLLADLHACFGEALAAAWTDAATLRRGVDFAGRRLGAVMLPEAAPPTPRPAWTVPAGAIVARAVESPSGMEKLLGCPLAWSLHYAARLRADGPAMLPDLDRLTGSFLHRVLQLLFESGDIAPGQAGERARALFTRLLPEEAAPLLHPGREADRARALERLLQSVNFLANELAEAGLEVEDVEREMQRALPGGGLLTGRLDLLLRRPRDGLRLILDAKWARSNRHRKALADDSAIQLAAYAWLAEMLGGPVSAGYFLIRQGRLHIAGQAPIPAAAIAGADLADTWARALRDQAAALADVRAGTLRAAGIAPDPNDADAAIPDADRLPIKPPCGWCDFRALCGATG